MGTDYLSSSRSNQDTRFRPDRLGPPGQWIILGLGRSLSRHLITKHTRLQKLTATETLVKGD